MKDLSSQFKIIGRIAGLLKELDDDVGADPQNGLLDIERVSVSDLNVDAGAYQFRTAVNSAGTDKRLSSISRWDDLRAGVMVVHERKDGKRFVADGHHRIELAKKLGVKGINAFILKESEGHSVESAKALAALVNLSNNNGTGIDAAKLFRSKLRDMNPEQLVSDLNLPKNSAVKTGVSLAKLSDDVFGAVLNGLVEERDGAVIGDTFADPAEQQSALSKFMAVKPANAEESQVLAQQIKIAGFMKSNNKGNTDMFGNELETDTVLGERTRLIVALGRAYKKDKSLFETLGINASKIEQAGNHLSKDSNSKLANDSTIMQAALGEHIYTNPAMMGAINAAALELKKSPGSMADILGRLKIELEKAAILNIPEPVIDTQTASMFDDAGDDYFQIIGEGAQILKRLSEDSPEFFADLARLREIIAALGEDAGQADTQPAGLVFSVDNKEASAAALVEYANGAMLSLPDYMVPFERLNVEELAKEVGALNALPVSLSVKPDTRQKLLSSLVARGVKVDDSVKVEDIAAKSAMLNEAVKIKPGDDPEYAAAFEKRNQAYADFRKLIQSMPGDDLEDPEYIRVRAEYHALRDALSVESDARWKAAVETRDSYIKVCQDALNESGTKIIQAVMDASRVTEEQATEWAKRQIVEKSAIAKLKKLKYPYDDFIRDMAEFYRISGGKASIIRFSNEGSRRAFANGIETRTGEKIISLGSRFNKTVLWHEMAHHLENDAIAKGAANGYLEKRRTSEKLHSLKSLTGNSGYRSSEKAYTDSFIDPYIGKYYRDGATEVFSMGVQYLAYPYSAALFYSKDPELFAMVSGYLTSPATPALQAKLHLHGGAVVGRIEEKKVEAKTYEASVEKLAASVQIVKDGWYDGLSENGRAFLITRMGYDMKNNAKPLVYVGSFAGYRVFSGVVLNGNTKRHSAGYMVVDNAPDDVTERPLSRSFHGTEAELKVFLRLCADGAEDGIYKVWRKFFSNSSWEGDRIKNVLKYASAKGAL